MKPNFLVSKMSLTLCTAFTLLAFSAQAQIIEDAAGGKFSEALKGAKTELELKKATAERFDDIAMRMGGNRKIVFDFFKHRADKMSEASSQAWSELLRTSKVSSRKKVITQQDSLNAQTTAEMIAHYIDIKTSPAADKLDINELDLVKTNSWEPKQRENFSKVLKRTAELAKTSNLPTQNDAFEQALKDLGYWAEYVKGCK